MNCTREEGGNHGAKLAMSDTEEEEVSLRVMDRTEDGERASLVRDSVRPIEWLVEEAAIIDRALSLS